MITLQHEMMYHLRVESPLQPEDGSPPSEQREWWQMSSATLDGPRIKATTPLPGLDWLTPLGDGYGRPHVRLPFRTDDGALVLLDYHGIVHGSDALADAVAHDQPSEWGDQYMRMVMFFETTSERYRWLAQSLFLARGRALGAKNFEFEVYRID